jgi:hypothetical protein
VFVVVVVAAIVLVCCLDSRVTAVFLLGLMLPLNRSCLQRPLARVTPVPALGTPLTAAAARGVSRPERPPA